MFQAVCDYCGDADDEGEFYAWGNADQADEVAIASEWTRVVDPMTHEERLCCPGCLVYDEELDEYVPKAVQ